MPRADPPLYLDCPAPAVAAIRVGVPLRPTAWSGWDALWAVLGSIVIGTAVAVILLAAGVDLAGPSILLTVMLPWIALAGWPIWVTRRRGNGAEVDLGWRFQSSDVLKGLIGGAAAFGAAIISGLVSVWLFGDFSSAAGDQAAELAQRSGPAVLVLFAIMVAIGAPIAEELTFRGLLWSGLAKRGSAAWVPIAVSSLAFAAIHFEPQRLLVLASVGAVLGVVRWRTGSLGACVIAHGVNNLPGALGILALIGTG